MIDFAVSVFGSLDCGAKEGGGACGRIHRGLSFGGRRNPGQGDAEPGHTRRREGDLTLFSMFASSKHRMMVQIASPSPLMEEACPFNQRPSVGLQVDATEHVLVSQGVRRA